MTSETNSIVARGGRETMQEIEALLIKLDVPVAQVAAKTSYIPYSQAFGAYTALATKPGPPSPEQTQYLQMEREISQLADVCRKLANEQNSVSQRRRDQLTKQLNERVAKAFEVRQEMRRQDLQRLRERLEKVEFTLHQREEAKAKIIEQRVASLLDADRDAIAQRPLPARREYQRPLPPGLESPGNPLGLRGPLMADPVQGDGSGIGLVGPASSAPRPAATPYPNSPIPLRGSNELLELLHAAERCREAAAGPDLQHFDRAVAAYRTVERRFKTYVELATIELQAAEANFDQLTGRQDRLQALYKSGVTSSEEFEKARGETQAARFAVQRAEVTKEFYDQLLDEAKTIVAEAVKAAKGEGDTQSENEQGSETQHDIR